MVALYLHVPFCHKKCGYCSFSSRVVEDRLLAPYLTALKQELYLLAGESNFQKLDSLFIGGGTPSVLPSSMLADLVSCCFQLFPPTISAEISVEVNPGTVNASYLKDLLLAGVNRLSFGVQSFNDRELLVLGRIHNGQEAQDAILSAKSVGFSNINLDLMYGLPGQTVQSWQDSLLQAIALRPQHLSLYQLTIEEGTPFHNAVATGQIILPEEETVLQMDEVTSKVCVAGGLQQYEISNYATPGNQCVHNINYWHNGDYLACGVSAVSCLGGVREKRIDDPCEYIRRMQSGVSVVADSETLSLDASFRESVVMGLRLTEGVSMARLQSRYHIDIVDYYEDILVKLVKLQLVELTASHLRLTSKGWPLANWVMAELV